MATLSPQGKFRALDENGNPLNGGMLFTYEAGTSTPKPTYTDESENTANTNPVILDSEGYADVWLESGSYKFVLQDMNGVEQWTVDNIAGSATGAFGGAVVEVDSNLNVTSVYRNNLLVTSQGVTLTLLPAAQAGEGFLISVQNESLEDVTIDPDGFELINGESTFIIPAGGGGSIVCDGSDWRLLSMVDAEVPVGATVDYYGATLPSAKWAFPVGQEVSRTAFATLFARLGEQFGSGDGSTTFNLPDLRGRDAKPLDNMGGVAANRITTLDDLGKVGGVESTSTTEGHALTIGEMPPHTHSISSLNSTAVNGAGGFFPQNNSAGTTGSTGDGEAHSHDILQANLLDPYIGCNVIMRLI